MFLEKKREYEANCVLIELDFGDFWNNLLSQIDEKDLYKPEVERYGKETDPHVTLLYPVNPGTSFDSVKSTLDRVIDKKIDIVVNGIDIFENPEFDVIKLNVIADKYLQQIHDELSNLPNSEVRVYKPHITLAFTKKGTGAKYKNNNYKHMISCNRIKFTTSDGDEYYYSI